MSTTGKRPVARRVVIPYRAFRPAESTAIATATNR